MRTENDVTYQREETFVPHSPDPSAWKIKKPKFVISPKDKMLLLCISACILFLTILGTVFFIATLDDWTKPTIPSEEIPTVGDDVNSVLYGTSKDFQTILPSDFYATQAAVANVNKGELIAGIGEDTRVYPASLTKVMTLLVVAEQLKSEAALQDTVVVSKEVTEAMFAEGSSGMGIEAGDRLTVESLMYALMLQSDGTAACTLARYIAGSESAFVTLMNEKAHTMGLTSTHFVNPTGLHHENHYSSCRDLASLMGYAMNVPLCRKIMTEKGVPANWQNSSGEDKGMSIWNNLLTTYFNKYRDINPDKAGNVTVIAGKTGYTPEAGVCLVTYAEGADGQAYVCVTTGVFPRDTTSYKRCIQSYQSLYSKYVK